ncbi:MAG: hypothetical protein Kow0098_17840 [Ignavibacteriaceae bacterium]
MMKTIFLFLIFTGVNSFAQWSSATIKLGSFGPSATEAGFIIGYEGGKSIDEIFNFGWSLDWFHKSYVDKDLVEDFNNVYGISGGLNELRAETNLHDFPLMINVTGRQNVAPRTDVFISGSVGAEVLIIDYNNFENPDESELQGAYDFNWRIGVGGLYQLSQRADLLLEFSYHSSKPSWEYEVDDPVIGKRTFERVFDMSGLMARLGFRFYY